MIAPPGQNESTSGNVCIYRTNIKNHSFFLLDFEGAQGSYPRRLRELWGKAWNILELQSVPFSFFPASIFLCTFNFIDIFK
jgi:hypothetical protein